MSQEETNPRLSILHLITFCALLALVVALMYRSMLPDNGVDQAENGDATKNVKTDDSDDDETALDEGETFDRESARKQGVRLVEAEEIRSPGEIEGVKIAVQKDRVYDSILKWNVVGKVEDKSWTVRKLVNMVYISEAVVQQTVEENDGEEIIVVYDFRSIKSFKALYELESIQLDFLEGAPDKIRATSSILAPVFDMIVPGSGVQVRITGAVLALQSKPALENLAKRGYKLVFDPAKANEEIKMFGQINSMEGKKVRVTHRKGAVAKIVPLGCQLTASERNFCMNLGVLANYHMMPEPDKKIGERWNVKASNFANILEPTLRGVPSGIVELRLKSRAQNDGNETATLEIVKGTIELDSSDPKMSRLGKCTPKGTMTYDIGERYVTQGTLTADISLERTSKKHLLFETRFKTNPQVVIDYQCSKNAKEDREVLRVPDMEKEQFQPVPVELFSPLDWK